MIPKFDRLSFFGLTLGAFATIGQIILMRETLALGGGNELLLGVSLAIWLAAVATGAAPAHLLSNPARGLHGVATVGGFLPVVEVLLARDHRWILGLGMGEQLSVGASVAVLAVCLAPPAMAVGYLFTAAARITSARTPGASSRLYGWEAVGALVSGLLFSLVLAGRVPHLPQLWIVAGGMGIGVVGLTDEGRRRRWLTIPAFLVCFVLPAFWLASHDSSSIEGSFDRQRQGGTVVAHGDSPYGRLVLAEMSGQLALYRDGRLDHAFPDPWNRRPPVHMALAQHPDPRKVLIIGGGIPDRLEAALEHHPARVVLTFLDPLTLEIETPFFGKETREAMEDPRVELVPDDGRHYVSSTAQRFDAIMVFAPPPVNGRDNRYHTREFYLEAREILEPGGVLSVLAPGSTNVMTDEASRAASITLATLRSVFREVIFVPGLEMSMHASATPGVVSDDPGVLADRVTGRLGEDAVFGRERLEADLDPSRLRKAREQLDLWPSSIDTDSRPLSYLANLQLWEQGLAAGRSTGGATITGLARRIPWIILALVLATWIVWRTARRKNAGAGDALFSIGTTGAAGMGLEVMVLYRYQSSSGVLYVGLALIVALFMAGLAAGVFAATVSGLLKTRRRGLAADGLMLVILIITPLILTNNLPSWSIALWSLVAGAATGVAFPVFVAVAGSRRSGGETRSVGLVEVADHFGAAFGALVTGIVWMPVLGVERTCLCFGLIKAASMAGQLLSTPRRAI